MHRIVTAIKFSITNHSFVACLSTSAVSWNCKTRSNLNIVVIFPHLKTTATAARTAVELPAQLINDAVRRSPQLKYFTKDEWKRTFDALTGQGLSVTSFMTIIEKRPQLLKCSPEKLVERIENLRKAQYGDQDLFKLIEERPQFLGSVTWTSRIWCCPNTSWLFSEFSGDNKPNKKRVSEIAQQIDWTWILTWSLSRFKRVAVRGVIEFPVELIDDLIERKPQLKTFSKEQWQRTFDTLTGQGLSISNFMTIIGKRPQLLKCSPEKLVDSIELLRSAQFSDRDILMLLEKHPEFLGITTTPGNGLSDWMSSYNFTADSFQNSMIKPVSWTS